MTAVSLWHMVQYIFIGGLTAIVFAFLMWKLFDSLFPFDTAELIKEHGQVGLFAGLVLGLTILGSFIFAGHVLG